MKKTSLLGFTLCLAMLAGCWYNKESEEKKGRNGAHKKIAQITSSGLKYKILKEGASNALQANDGKMVTVHYTGWLNDKGKRGKEVDSTIRRNQKFSFLLGQKQVISGFDEGIKSMKVGEKRRLTIPPHLAYGKNKVGNIIPENASLIFDVELLEVS